MNGASKILTVSYGTFSCTLEGFDDPFNTMKAIAEYFRDLAAEDRYFGAEPPQPDAAMLHKIAEREIQRRVEAKIDANGVTLRAGPDADLGPDIATDTPRPQVHMPSLAPPRAPAPVLAGADTVAASVAEKLSRMRKASGAQAAHHDAGPSTSAGALPDEDDGFDVILPAVDPAMALVPDTPSPEALDDDAKAPAANGVDATELHPALPQWDDIAPQDDDDALTDLAALDGVAAADMTEDYLPEDELPQGDMLGNDLPEDLVAQDDPGDVPATEGYDDLAAAAVLAALGADLRTDAPAIAAAPPVVRAAPLAAADDTALMAALGQLIDPEEDDFDDAPSVAVQADTMEADTSLTDIAALPQAETVTVVVPSPAPAPQPQAPAVEADRVAATVARSVAPPPVVAPVATPQPEAEGSVRPVRPVRPARADAPQSAPAADQPAAAQPAPAQPAPAHPPATTPDAPASLATLQRARARVIKIRRGDATIVPTDTPAATRPLPHRPLLTDEAEAALAAELAALEADIAPEPARAPTPAAGAAGPVPQARTTLGPAGEEAVNRLMSEANSQMDGPETKRRQSAIAHLKAAVAATVAERKATGNTLAADGKGRIEVYRNDLAAVVRPPPGTTEARAAPLVLVSEQRIDRPAPVMPRRVVAQPAVAKPATTMAQPLTNPALADDLDDTDDTDAVQTAANIFGTSDSFADFADRLGANGLTGLLEAAAAYIACVEGRDSFTRPQLMRHISAAQGDLGREDGLRSFGILLRDGVIEKTKRGQFALSDRSALLAEARKIAG